MTAAPPAPKKSSGADARAAVVEQMNRDHALILLGDRPVVLREGQGSDGRDEIRLLSLAGFHEWKRPDVVWLDADGASKKVQASKIWVDSDERRQYDGLVFDPSCTSPRSYYNLWRGFAVEPAPKGTEDRCARFLAHVHDNVCSGNAELFLWVIGWFAAIVQRPTDKLGTSLVLRGTQGTGKTIVGRLVGQLLGQHYALVADSRYIVGRFNSHLANCLLLQLDEATWGGDHAAAGKLKDLVTGEWQYIEYKGKEPVRVRNYVRLLVTGNNNWLVPAGLEERRFAVLDVGEGQRQSHEYFQAIEDEFADGGREALLRFLLDFDLSRVNLRQIPATAALAEQKLSSLSPEQNWWLDVLNRGQLPGDTLGEGVVETHALYAHYLEQLQRMGYTRKASETAFGIALRRMAPGITRKRGLVHLAGGTTSRPWVYALPLLAECRREFDRLTGDDSGWSDAAPEKWMEATAK
jgi:hypothetical protein